MRPQKHSAAQRCAVRFQMDDSRADLGIIVTRSTGRYGVQLLHEVIPCTLAGRLRHQLWEQSRSQHDPLAVGDRVRVSRAHGAGGVIVELLPRRNLLARRAAGRKARQQVIAANADRVACTIAVEQPAMRLNLLDRFLVEAESAGVEPLIVLTKVDLDADGVHRRELDAYCALGYTVLHTSSLTGEGIDELRRTLAGRTSVLLGSSGVGKSSLLNALEPGLALRANPISRATGKGQHTTTMQEMFALSDGGYLIDTPGVREFALWDVSGEDLASHFREMQPLIGQCRCSGCTHVHEPDCAIKDAVQSGRIGARRYRSYLRMLGAEQIEQTVSHDADSQRRAQRPQSGSFACRNCGHAIPTQATGTDHRNHCPRCLHSLHVDQRPGDRAAACGGIMEPISVWVRTGGEWALIHRCRDCGILHSNRIAGDDAELALITLAVRPLSKLPFPIEQLPLLAAAERAGGVAE